MLDALDACARTLRRGAPAFTRRNLLHALRHARGGELTEPEIEAALCKRLGRGPVEGLLPASHRWRAPRLGREWDAYFPKAVLLVDRPAVLDLFVASGVIATGRLAVVCLDGTPAPVVDWLRRGFRAGRRAPVAYVHDAASIVYPFTIEPLATLVRESAGSELAFRDLGIPPHGFRGGAFTGAALPEDERILELEALPPSALLSYAARAAMRMVPGDPNMLPLVREDAGAGREVRR